VHEPALTIDDVREAAARIAGVVHRTPVLRSRTIDRMSGGEVVLKAEHLQRTGSFKARGAANKIARLDADQRAAGIYAISSGNHSAAVAWAGARHGCRVDVHMPADAPVLKRRATEAYGGVVHEFDRSQDRDDLIGAWLEEHGSTLVSPYDDLDVMAGQGTAALELHEQAEVDTVVVPVSGGGLLAGSAVATRGVRPRCRIVAVEPAGADDTARSFAAGERVSVRPDTIADGLMVTTPGRLTFPINRQLVDEVVTVTEDEIRAAMVVLFERAKQVVEPSGATALAGVVAGKVTSAGGTIGVVLSGGNVDPARFASLVDGIDVT
jgi:threonine dehydratase